MSEKHDEEYYRTHPRPLLGYTDLHKKMSDDKRKARLQIETLTEVQRQLEEDAEAKTEKKTREDELFEEVDKLHTNHIQSYDKKHMLDKWLANQNYQLTILPTFMYELFCKLDEELLIGDNFEAWYANEMHVSGIFGNFNNAYLGTGDYIGI